MEEIMPQLMEVFVFAFFVGVYLFIVGSVFRFLLRSF